MRAIEIFAGAGGLGLGVSRAGFTPAVVIKWDRYCCDTIRENQDRGLCPLVHWPLVEGDVRDFDFGSIGGEMDLVSGGPPCQPFSLGGKHRGHLDDRDMFPQAIRSVRQLRPRAFLFENVKGLTRPTFANYFEYTRLQFTYPELSRRESEDWADHFARLERHHTYGLVNDLNYRVVTRVLNAADFGVPQRRERVFIIGFRADLGIEWSFPEPTHSHAALLWSQWRSGEYWESHRLPRRSRSLDARTAAAANRLRMKPAPAPWRTVRDILSNLPDPEWEPESVSR